MTQPSQPERRRGRPRDAAIDEALLNAALAEFTAHGVHRLQMGSIAAAAGVSKVTLYRRWKSRRDVVVDVFRAMAGIDPATDHGSLRADLDALLADSVGTAGARANAVVVLRTLGEVSDDPALFELYRQYLLGPRLEQLRRLVDRATARGELRAGLDADVVAAAISGPILALQLGLLTGTVDSEGLRVGTVHAIIVGIGVRSAQHRQPEGGP